MGFTKRDFPTGGDGTFFLSLLGCEDLFYFIADPTNDVAARAAVGFGSPEW